MTARTPPAFVARASVRDHEPKTESGSADALRPSYLPGARENADPQLLGSGHDELAHQSGVLLRTQGSQGFALLLGLRALKLT